jgi:hypothetical protein
VPDEQAAHGPGITGRVGSTPLGTLRPERASKREDPDNGEVRCRLPSGFSRRSPAVRSLLL